MADIAEMIASYGQLGALLWIVFEVRDLRRMHDQHIEIMHAKPARTRANGKG